MHHIVFNRGRSRALALAAALLLALCLLAAGVAALDPGTPRYVVGDILEVDFANQTAHMVIGSVDTTSLPTPLYTAFLVEQNGGRWEIPRYWHNDLEYTDESFERMHARRAAHVDPVLVIITDDTITGGDMLYYGLSLAEAKTGGAYWVEQPPGESSGYPNSYIAGDILGNVSDTNSGSVVSKVYESDGAPWARVYFDTVRSGDRWMIEKFYNGDMGFPMTTLGRNESRRVAHADPHTVIINDTTTNTGEIGWYRLSLAEFLAGKYYDGMGYWHFNTGDILANGTATRYIVGAANVSDSGPSHYTLYEVMRGADGWTIPAYVDAGIPTETGLTQPDGTGFDLVDHTDPHFAVVTDPAVSNGLTFNGLSLGEILEGTPGYPPESPGPVGGDVGYFLVSTVPAGADVYLEDISGTPTLQGNTSAGPLNVTVHLTATPVRAIVANLTGYRDAVYSITQYPAKDQTLPVGLTLVPIGGPTPYKPHPVPGRIEAEDYDLGGEGVAYHDTTPGNTGGAYRSDGADIESSGGITNVGWVRSGEWLTYTVNVTRAGDYYPSLRVASPNAGRYVEVQIDGAMGFSVRVPRTGSFEAFTTTSGVFPSPGETATVVPKDTGNDVANPPAHLEGGTHTVVLRFWGDGQNIDWFELAPLGGHTPTPTPTPSDPGPSRPLAIPGAIEAEDYDLGGEGLAYHDTTPGNTGGAYRSDGVDIESSGGTTNIGWVRNGEWLTYTANVTAAGTYSMGARVASPNGGRTIEVSVDGVPAATITIPNTGSFASFRTVSVPVTLAAGTHTLKLAFTGDGQNLDSIAFVPLTPRPICTGCGISGASFTAAPLTAAHGSAVKFTLTPASGKSVGSAWWSFDAASHLNTWNSRAMNPTFYYPAAGTFSPLVKVTYTDGSSETVQRTNYIRAT